MDHRRRTIGMSTWLALLLAALVSSYVFGSGDLMHDASGIGKDAKRMLREMGIGN